MTHWISPHHLSSEFPNGFTTDDKIAIFEGRVLGWHLDIADWIRNEIEKAQEDQPQRHAGFALLGMLFMYFEMIAQFERGESSKSDSPMFFSHGIDSVFPNAFTAKEKTTIYNRVRCGMFHNGFVKQGVRISSEYETPIKLADDIVYVNPHSLSDCIRKHCKAYVASLRTDAKGDCRAKFEKMWTTK